MFFKRGPKGNDNAKKDGELRSKEELESQNVYIDWWPRAQLESRYAKDKTEGFYSEQTTFDKLLLGTKEQIVRKMYMLEFKMQDEMVKECMIKWAQNIGHNLSLIHI